MRPKGFGFRACRQAVSQSASLSTRLVSRSVFSGPQLSVLSLVSLSTSQCLVCVSVHSSVSACLSAASLSQPISFSVCVSVHTHVSVRVSVHTQCLSLASLLSSVSVSQSGVSALPHSVSQSASLSHSSVSHCVSVLHCSVSVWRLCHTQVSEACVWLARRTQCLQFLISGPSNFQCLSLGRAAVGTLKCLSLRSLSILMSQFRVLCPTSQCLSPASLSAHAQVSASPASLPHSVLPSASRPQLSGLPVMRLCPPLGLSLLCVSVHTQCLRLRLCPHSVSQSASLSTLSVSVCVSVWHNCLVSQSWRLCPLLMSVSLCRGLHTHCLSLRPTVAHSVSQSASLSTLSVSVCVSVHTQCLSLRLCPHSVLHVPPLASCPTLSVYSLLRLCRTTQWSSSASLCPSVSQSGLFPPAVSRLSQSGVSLGYTPVSQSGVHLVPAAQCLIVCVLSTLSVVSLRLLSHTQFLESVVSVHTQCLSPRLCPHPVSQSASLDSTSVSLLVKVLSTSAHVDQGMVYLKPGQIQAKPTCKPCIAKVNVHTTSAHVDQDNAHTTRKHRSFPRAAPIPQEERAAEVEAIHKELVIDLGMVPVVALKVVKAATRAHKGLSLANCRGWIATLRQLGLDDKGMIQGLLGCPKILAYSAGGREEQNREVLRVLEQGGLCSAQHNIVELLKAEGFPEPLIQRMILGSPALLMLSPGGLGPMMDYVAWVVGSKETAVNLFIKKPCIFGKRPTSIHAKLLMMEELVGFSPSSMLTRNSLIATNGMHTRIGPRCIILKELGMAENAELMYKSTWLIKNNSDFATWPMLVQAYHAMGRQRFPATNSLEEAILVCQKRWDYEWKAKFDERSLMMQAEWKVTGIAGLPTIGNLMCKEE
eukprot:gene32028-16555_t